MFQIELTNAHGGNLDEEFLREVAIHAIKDEQLAAADVVIALVNDATILEVNRRHLAHDYPTDVISFLYDSTPRSVGAPSSGCGLEALDGELVISVDTAARAATEHGWSLREELALYVVHGLLHLCGFDDQNPTDRQRMRQREREVLSRWKITPPGSEGGE